MEHTYTISVFTENAIGMLNRITIIFTRRHLNIDSITASESELKGVFRYTIVVRTSADMIAKVIGQIEKLVDVLRAFVHGESDVVHQELALYKIRTGLLINSDVEKIIREHHARILSVDPEFVVIEKTGHVEDTEFLFDHLKAFGILEFARSGRVAVTKPMKELGAYLKELEQLN